MVSRPTWSDMWGPMRRASGKGRRNPYVSSPKFFLKKKSKKNSTELRSVLVFPQHSEGTPAFAPLNAFECTPVLGQWGSPCKSSCSVFY